jgi:hypothetical protein
MVSRCGVRQKIVPAPPRPPWRGSRKRDPICYRVSGKFLLRGCSAVEFSSFSILQPLRDVCIAIIV